jgi:hypothetical protein
VIRADSSIYIPLPLSSHFAILHCSRPYPTISLLVVRWSLWWRSSLRGRFCAFCGKWLNMATLEVSWHCRGSAVEAPAGGVEPPIPGVGEVFDSAIRVDLRFCARHRRVRNGRAGHFVKVVRSVTVSRRLCTRSIAGIWRWVVTLRGDGHGSGVADFEAGEAKSERASV